MKTTIAQYDCSAIEALDGTVPGNRPRSLGGHGSRAHYAGVVICRQRPATASGVTFMTLEDETGFVNLVLWSRVFQEYRVFAKTLSFMGVSGKIQAQEGVVHLIVDRVWRPELRQQPALKRSRDFR